MHIFEFPKSTFATSISETIGSSQGFGEVMLQGKKPSSIVRVYYTTIAHVRTTVTQEEKRSGTIITPRLMGVGLENASSEIGAGGKGEERMQR